MIGARGIAVTQVGAQAFVATDKKTLKPIRVNIPHLPDDADDRLCFAIQGFIDHEIGHVLDTDWAAVAESEKRGATPDRARRAKMTPQQAGQFMSQVHNVVEDPYVERKMAERFKGSAYNVDKLHDIFIEKISKPAIERAKTPQDRFGCIFVALVRSWACQQKFTDFIVANGYDKDPLVDAYSKLVPEKVKQRIGKTKDSWETLEIAEILFDIMHPEPPPPPPAMPQQSMADAINEEMKDQEEQSDSKKSDDPDGEGNNQDKPEDEEDNGSDGDQSDEQQPAGEEGDDGEGDTGEGEKDGKEGEEAEGSEGEGEADDESEADEGDGSEADAEGDQEGAGGRDGDQDEDERENGDSEGKSDAGDEEDDGEEAGGDDAGAGGSEGSEPLDEDDGDEAGDDDASGDDKGDAEGDAEGGSGDQDGEGDDEGSGAKGENAEGDEDADGSQSEGDAGDNDDGGDEGESDEGEADGEVGSEADDQADGQSRPTGEKADAEDEAQTVSEHSELAPESNPFMGAEIENLGDDMAKGIAFIITNEATRSIKGLDYRVYTTEWDVCEKFPVPEGNPELEVYRKGKRGRYECEKVTLNGLVTELDERTGHMVAPMQKDIERMMAARSQVLKVPGFRSGRLHSGSLHRLRTGDDRVFRRLEEHKSQETAVTLLIDNSGSMSGEKMEMAMSAGYALSSTLQRVNIKHEVIGFTTMIPRGVKDWAEQQEAEEERIGRKFSRYGALYHPIYKEVNERLTPDVKRRFAIAPYTCPMQGNTDGEAVRFAGNRLAMRQEPRKVLIVLSDGHPAGMSYYSDEIYSDLHKAVEECEKKRIETIGIGIMDSSVKTFYPKAVVLKDLAELPKQVMKELKGILLQ
nr:hypothetical protein [Bradyrhizobium sp. 179]